MDEVHKSDEIWVTKFDEESAQKFRDAVMEQSKMDPQKPIIIYIDSYGGNVDSLAKMLGVMDEVRNPTITVCQGKAMSCGAVLLSHGDLRFCDPLSRVMVHEVSSATIGDVHDMKTDTDETKRINELFLGLLAKNCGHKGGYADLRKIIKDKDGRDIYMSAKQALEFGIVDVVGLPRLNSSIMHEITAVPPKNRLRDTNSNVKELNKKSRSESKKSRRKR